MAEMTTPTALVVLREDDEALEHLLALRKTLLQHGSVSSLLGLACDLILGEDDEALEHLLALRKTLLQHGSVSSLLGLACDLIHDIGA
jgi:hypothetical protein